MQSPATLRRESKNNNIIKTKSDEKRGKSDLFQAWFPYNHCGSLAVFEGRYEFVMTFKDHM